ncbi:MAG TPA: hypothetical protein VNO14_04410 [Blastocatellia bacterium]|nr:hypothetical protein [Blastocatellia bacterium]
MPKGNSMVVVGVVINNGLASPILKVVVSDPDGIDKVEVFSRHNAILPVEVRQLVGCPAREQMEFVNFPLGWFPIRVSVTDCVNLQNPQPGVDKTHGPFDENGNMTGPPQQQPQQDQPQPLPEPPDFQTPTDVSQLPLALDRADVKRLLGVSDVELDAIIDRGDLTAFGQGKTRVARGSLARLLGL